MPSSLASHRHHAFVRQSFRCFYCDSPVWETNPSEFVRRYGVSERQARLLQCTAEHLHARCDGGTNARCNIVAACRFCNTTRHRSLRALDPAAYRTKVRLRVARGKWLPRIILEANPQQT
jgi:hypothetical protein